MDGVVAAGLLDVGDRDADRDDVVLSFLMDVGAGILVLNAADAELFTWLEGGWFAVVDP